MQVDPSNVEDTGVKFTCNTCGLTFPTADLQRLHMRTDWHRYNLKRRVAQLPPITSEMFAEKMLQQEKMQQMEQEKVGRGSSRRSTGQRQMTKKDRKKEEKLMKKMAGMNLKKSQKEQESGNDDEDDDDDEEEEDEEIERPGTPHSMVSSTFSLGEPVDDDKTDDLHSVGDHSEAAPESVNDEETEIQKRLARAVKIPPHVCFVDGKEFANVQENVDYMEKKYGLFIPEREYLVDLEGLIGYLGEKIGLGNLCLYCNFQGRGVESVRQHMISKGHVKIPYEAMESKLEISDYYDFRGSYRQRPVVQDDGDDDWEDEEVVDGEHDDDDDDDDDELDSEDEGDGAYVDETGYELSLPSGYRAGHRTLARYYNQNLRPSTVTREGQGTVMAVDTKSILKVRDPVQAKQQKLAWQSEKKAQNIERRRGKMVNFQKHYRDELLQ